jgi:hypothetical protein
MFSIDSKSINYLFRSILGLFKILLKFLSNYNAKGKRIIYILFDLKYKSW